jgi:glycosyltransferase involved in cell wall biosynthesis
MTPSGPPMLTVVTVCFNAAATLGACIASVAAGKSAAVEYLIIDGASTDETMAVIEAHRGVVDALVSEPDAGIFDAMNKGVSKACGDFVVYLNADDVFLPGALAAILTAIAQRGSAIDVLYGDWIGVDAAGMRHHRIADHRLRARYSLCHQAVVARRSIFPKPRAFDVRYSLCADFDLILYWQQQGQSFERLAQPLVQFSEIGASARFMRRSARQSIAIALHRARFPWTLIFSARVALYVVRVSIASWARRGSSALHTAGK